MPMPIDIEPGEEMVKKHIKLTKQTWELANEDAFKYAGGSLSMWLRMLIRKSRDIKERNQK